MPGTMRTAVNTASAVDGKLHYLCYIKGTGIMPAISLAWHARFNASYSNIISSILNRLIIILKSFDHFSVIENLRFASSDPDHIEGLYLEFPRGVFMKAPSPPWIRYPGMRMRVQHHIAEIVCSVIAVLVTPADIKRCSAHDSAA